jgi:hypothetical protein
MIDMGEPSLVANQITIRGTIFNIEVCSYKSVWIANEKLDCTLQGWFSVGIGCLGSSNLGIM